VLIAGLAASHETSKREILNLYTIDPGSQGLDPGELHLFAWLKGQRILPGELILISTAE
jgi:hypothetical protein